MVREKNGLSQKSFLNLKTASQRFKNIKLLGFNRNLPNSARAKFQNFNCEKTAKTGLLFYPPMQANRSLQCLP
jgi:hypothetical protein